MNYSQFFSDDVPSFMRSPVREIFRKVDLASIYSFAGGYPDAATFPVGEMEALTRRVMEKYGARALQYGATQGVTELREAVAGWYGPRLLGENGHLAIENIQITTSSQQGIDICARVFLNPGDVVYTTNPAYLGALQSFKAYRADIREIPAEAFSSAPVRGCAAHPSQTGVWAPPPNTAGGGMPLGGEGLRGKGAPKLIYVVPDFCNPSGVTLTLEERKALVDFARREDLLIIEDSPYRELRYEGTPVPTIYSLAPERTLHLGSFSKVFAPGFRLGWMIADRQLLEQIFVCKQALDLCPPVFDQYLALEFLCSGALDRNLARSLDLYRTKRDRLLALLQKYMSEGVSWTHPEGGLFVWVTLPQGVDTVAMYEKALSAGVAYVAGSFFYLDGSYRNTMRLNFSFLDIDRMEEGMRILAGVLSDAMRFRKMSGAGNNFVMADGRAFSPEELAALRAPERVRELCSTYGTDGLIILNTPGGKASSYAEKAPEDDSSGPLFGMEFFNPDGSGGMMCGNGGRCIVAFADYLGLIPEDARSCVFMAPDGAHRAEILQRPGTDGGEWTVRLRMKDVDGVERVQGGLFLNTGTRHFVKFVPDVEAVDVEKEGAAIRNDVAFAPEGTNVNFVQACDGFLKVRTFEKGVEGETLACGTGITASAIAAFFDGKGGKQVPDGRISCRIQARRDALSVDFVQSPEPGSFRDVYLTGPAVFE